MINLGPYSGKNCPNVRYHPGIIDRALEVAALLIVLIIWGCIYWLYTQKGVSNSPEIWIPGGMSVLCFIIMELSSYVPVRKINFPVRVNERNIGIQYLLAVRFTRVMNVILGLLFLSSLLLNYYRIASIYFGIAIALMFIAFVIYFIFAFRCK